MENIQVSTQSDVPIYRQIVTQLTFMIETGDLKPGESLPSARLLSDNLRINRNTVARAYSDLADLGLVEGRGRSGTVVVGPGPEQELSKAREQARAILETAARECIGFGLTAPEVQSLMASVATRIEAGALKVSFVECNLDRAKYFASELEAHIGVPVTPLVLGQFDPEKIRADLALTTFFHLAEVMALLRERDTEVVGIVVAPHVQTLVQIASVPKNRTVGIWYSTQDQATNIQDSLRESGIVNIKVLDGVADEDIADVDLVVVPSEVPHLRADLEGRVKLLEFGNILDSASVRMVRDVVNDMRAAKRP